MIEIKKSYIDLLGEDVCYIEACYHLFLKKNNSLDSLEYGLCIVWEVMSEITTIGFQDFAKKRHRYFRKMKKYFLDLDLDEFVMFIESAKINEMSDQCFKKADNKLIEILYQKLLKRYGSPCYIDE